MNDFLERLEKACDLANLAEVRSCIGPMIDTSDRLGAKETYLLIRSLRILRRTTEALEIAKKADQSLLQSDIKIASEVAFTLIASQEFERAISFIDNHSKKRDESLQRLLLVAEFLRDSFANRISHNIILIDNEQLGARILKMVEEGSPFHVSRLGDGEGMFWGGVDAPYKWRHSAYCAMAAMAKLKYWIGESALSLTYNDVQSLATSLFASYREADLIGINPNQQEDFFSRFAFAPSRNLFFGYFGHYACLTLMQKICDKEYFDAWAFHAIFDRDYFSKLHRASSGGTVFISSHSMNWLGDDIESIQIPAAHEDSHAGRQTPDSHYPLFFNSIIKALDENYCKGKLFIIGAGIFAKLYGKRIKDSGGMAIDVGSVLDYMNGYKTRGFK